MTKQGSDMVTIGLDIIDDLNGRIQLGVLCSFKLGLITEDTTRSTTKNISINDLVYLHNFRINDSTGIIESSSEEIGHIRLAIESIDEWLLSDVI